MKIKLLITTVVCLLSANIFGQYSFTLNPTSGCAPLTVSLTITGTTAHHYDWQIMEGGLVISSFTSYGDTTFIFTVAGDYSLGFTAFDISNNNLGYSTPQFITVSGSLGEFGIYTTGGYERDTFCIGSNVRFIYDDYTTDSLHWNFGNGNTANYYDVENTYTSVGSYQVELIVYTQCGVDTILDTVHIVSNLPYSGSMSLSTSPNPVCPGTEIYFSAFTEIETVTWLWNIDGNSFSADSDTLYTFNTIGDYPVSVICTNNCGDFITLRDTIHIVSNLPIELFANIDIIPNPACPGSTISFYLGLSGASTNSIEQYIWDFGDGTIDTLYNNSNTPNHIYTSIGTYPMTLTLINGCGNDTSIYDTIFISNFQPFTGIVNMSHYPDSLCPGDEFNFSTYGGNDIQSYLWDFGNGDTAMTQNPNYSGYSTPNIYAVSLTLTNTCGNDSIFYDTVIVSSNIPVDFFSVNAISDSLCINQDNYFYSQTWSQGNSPYSQFLWDFGNGDTAMTQYTSYTYADSGQFIITTTFINGCGLDSVITNNVVVVDCGNGINDYYSYDLVKTYPNPTTGKITVEAEGVEKVEVLNIQGRKVYSGSEMEIDISNNPKGIYFIKVTTEKGVAVEKITKN